MRHGGNVPRLEQFGDIGRVTQHDHAHATGIVDVNGVPGPRSGTNYLGAPRTSPASEFAALPVIRTRAMSPGATVSAVT